MSHAIQFTKIAERPVFITYWTKNLLILPPKYWSDVRRANREHLSFQAAMNGMLFQYKWLGDSINTELNQAVIMKGLNPQLTKLSSPLIEEADYALDLYVRNNPGLCLAFALAWEILMIIIRREIRKRGSIRKRHQSSNIFARSGRKRRIAIKHTLMPSTPGLPEA
jgi:uncharacterized protein YbcC (UPF0753/DUF2309 family)